MIIIIKDNNDKRKNTYVNEEIGYIVINMKPIGTVLTDAHLAGERNGTAYSCLIIYDVLRMCSLHSVKGTFALQDTPTGNLRMT